MASTINLIVLSEQGEELSNVHFNIEYGDEKQSVIVILSDPDSDDADRMTLTVRDALNLSMAEQLAMTDGYDA